MDCSVLARMEDYHSNQEHCVEMSSSCMEVQETKVLVSEQKTEHI